MTSPTRHRRRAGVPRDAVLAVRGRAADDRRQPGPRDAAVRARPSTRCSAGSSATATSRATRTGAIEFTPSGREHAEQHRQPPPDDRAVPDRRRRRALGRRPRGGREARARDDAALRGVRAHRGRATPRPARTATRSGSASGSTACRWPTARPGAKVTILRLENEAEDLLHYLKDAGDRAGARGRGRRQRRRERVGSLGRQRRATVTVERRRDRLGAWRIPRRRRGSRCPSNSCSAASATGAEAPPSAPPTRSMTRRQRALAGQAAADLVEDRRVVEQVEVGGAAEVVVVLDREAHPLAPAPRGPRRSACSTSRSPMIRPTGASGSRVSVAQTK